MIDKALKIIKKSASSGAGGERILSCRCERSNSSEKRNRITISNTDLHRDFHSQIISQMRMTQTFSAESDLVPNNV